MKYYAIGLIKALTCEKAMEGCGSFKIIQIDGRLTLDSAKEVAFDWYEKNKKINSLIGYRIYRAEKPSKCKDPIFVYNPLNLPIKEWD